MHLDRGSLVFLDSNVFIEHLFIPASAAAMVIDYATDNIFKVGASQRSIKDTETVILNKLRPTPELLDSVLKRWIATIQMTKLIIFPDPPADFLKQINLLYLPTMRHQADIPILGTAILANSTIILSGNREHFNDTVSEQCGIRIYSCAEFIKLLKPVQ